MSTTENRGQFGSKLGFILSAAGSAVGLGNIWKFPGKAYNCGGGAFLLVYIIMVALIGTTVMMAEFTVGRNAHKMHSVPSAPSARNGALQAVSAF